MHSLDSFLEHHIEKVVGGQQAPIDLMEVAQQAKAVVEEREMIPEAVMTPEAEGFRIYLQNNFSRPPGGRLRQRFSFAHEIVHTFFFELLDGAMKARRGVPTGERLEAACHRGAGLLLVPSNLLRKELRRHGDVRNAESILRLAREFDVSVEVIMRRLYDFDAFGLDFAPALARRDEGASFKIEFVVYPPWLKALFPDPRRGIDFAGWFGHTDEQEGPDDADHVSRDGALVKKTPQGTLTAQPVDLSPSLRIYELRLRP